MKLRPDNRGLRTAGILLLECVVYLSVLMVMLGIGGMAFYFCWDNARNLRRNADDILRTLRAGERWRADIRSATGPITVETEPDGQLLHIPTLTTEVLYAFTEGAVGRRLASSPVWVVVLPTVKASRMETDDRSQVKAWRWEVELPTARPKAGLRPLFSFTAVPPVSP